MASRSLRQAIACWFALPLAVFDADAKPRLNAVTSVEGQQRGANQVRSRRASTHHKTPMTRFASDSTIYSGISPNKHRSCALPFAPFGLSAASRPRPPLVHWHGLALQLPPTLASLPPSLTHDALAQ